jgi:uncharacterized protein (DUF2249 family)
MADNELDVRQLRKPDKHPTIFATYAALAVGESFVLVNNHDPKHLHEEFEADHAGSYGYRQELTEPERAEALAHLRTLAKDRNLTLLTASKAVDISEATVLAAMLS